MADAETLRALIGEKIPVGGSENDTLFTDEEIETLLAEASSIEIAAAKGWRMKAAAYVELVDTAEGTSKRAMSDLHKNALAMAQHYDPGAIEGTPEAERRTRSHQIVRR